MSVGPVWFPKYLEKSLQELKSRLSGHLPFINVADSIDEISSSFLKPTLYPQLTVPKDVNGDWADVFYHISHINRALDGIPELRVQGTETDEAIARSLNNELEWLAATYDGLVPPFTTEGKMLSQIEEYVKCDHTNDLNCKHVFWAFKLQNKKNFGAPQSADALALFSKHYPIETQKASVIQERISKIPINTLIGKVQAAKILIDELDFDRKKFYFQETTYSDGAYNLRSLDYYENLEAHENIALASIEGPFLTIDVQLPFHIPALQGCYKLENGIIILKNKTVSNMRASWKGEGETNIDSIMDTTGLYKNSSLQLIIPGIYDLNSAIPPHDKLYKNHKSYPVFIQDSVVLVNEFITYTRRNNERCDIPDIIPSHFNKVHCKQYDENRNIGKSVSTSFELIRVSTGVPQIDSELLQSEVIVKPQLFHSQLLESAKLHLLQSNSRRAILDYCGAFESFVSHYIVEHVKKSEETLKERFIRVYKNKLNDNQLALINSLVEANDEPNILPIRKLIDNYIKEGHKPIIKKSKVKKMLKIFDYRNDAAHGRPIGHFNLDDLELAIDLFEEIDQCFIS